jgi:hypothetical protein
MATRGHARGVGQRRLEAEPDPAPEPPDEAPPAGPLPAERPAPPPPEDLPEGSGAALRERQRRWLLERLRFDAAQSPPPADDGESTPPSG